MQLIPEPDSQAEMGIFGTGRTTCHPADMYDKNIGQTIALGRAMVGLGKQLENVGLSAIMTADDFVKRFSRGVMDRVEAEQREAQEPDPEPEPDTRPPVPPGIEKWAEEHGYRVIPWGPFPRAEEKTDVSKDHPQSGTEGPKLDPRKLVGGGPLGDNKPIGDPGQEQDPVPDPPKEPREPRDDEEEGS